MAQFSRIRCFRLACQRKSLVQSILPGSLAKPASYHASSQELTKDARVIDMRSDVLTQPTQAMREAMMKGTAGDDVFREDPTTLELERKWANLFGMEAALFVPSGTMGNLIGVLSHCYTRGLEVLLGDKSHLVEYEQGGMSQLGGVFARTIPNNPDGTFDVDKIDGYIRPRDDPHQPFTGLICVENTHNNCGGKAVPIDFLANVRQKANEHSVPVHMDGARMMNAAVALDVPPRDILQHVDSVSLCCSKGIGAPVGSILAGSGELIERALRLRKVLGGGWRQPGLLAAAIHVAMEDMVARLQQDHYHAQLLVEGVREKGEGIVSIDTSGINTNIVMIDTVSPGLTAQKLVDRLHVVTDQEYAELGEKVVVKSMAFYKHTLRIVMCHNHQLESVQLVIKKLQYILQEIASSQTS